jgi:predicted dinucleotide-binding enzyme
MKPIRSLVVFGAGIAAGLALAKRMTEDEPEVLHGPSQVQSSSNPALRAVTNSAQRMADRAAVASLEAIRRARGAIRERMTEDEDLDDAAWP